MQKGEEIRKVIFTLKKYTSGSHVGAQYTEREVKLTSVLLLSSATAYFHTMYQTVHWQHRLYTVLYH